MPPDVRDARSWNVVSGGPSRAYLKQHDLLNDAPVVTVNRAVDVVDRGIVVDFAMFADPPTGLASVVDFEKYLRPPIQLWCPRPCIIQHNGVLQILDIVTQWEPFLPASVGIRTTPFGQVPSPDGKTQRFIFALLGALERVLMFRPERVRVLCADMMGSWAPGMSEEECEMHQSQLEQAKREVSLAQKRVTETKGRDKTAEVQRDVAQATVNDLLKLGDPLKFKRWEHERFQLKELEKRANERGCTFEWVTPREVAIA